MTTRGRRDDRHRVHDPHDHHRLPRPSGTGRVLVSGHRLSHRRGLRRVRHGRQHPPLGFQRVDEPTPGKNRIHFDGTGGASRAEQVARLRELGAQEHNTHSLQGYSWTVMSDPEDNLFCVGDPGD